jgi:hypothetical protein
MQEATATVDADIQRDPRRVSHPEQHDAAANDASEILTLAPALVEPIPCADPRIVLTPCVR